MGRAEIISEEGAGLYTIQAKVETLAAANEHDRIVAGLSDVAARLATETDPAAIAFLNARKIALEKRQQTIAAIKDNPPAEPAWCADYSEGLTGEVGTLEIGAERRLGFNLQPGYEGGSVYDADRDGSLVPTLSLPTITAIYNYMLMPGVQKWRPTYRYGVISDIDYGLNTCTVTLDAALSIIDRLNINAVTVFTDVPVEYMSCDAQAFDDGDSVVVKWSPYDAESQPTVIGFKDHPRPCGYVLKLNSINGVALPVGPNVYKLRVTQPIEQEIVHGVKGTYMEDYTVIGEGDCDDAGVAEINIIPGITVDPNYPLNVQISNGSKWTYFTEDIKGAVPNFGITWPSSNVLEPYPTGDLSGYDYLVDTVPWIYVDIDLRTETRVNFDDADSIPRQGYLVDPIDVQIILHNYTTGDYTDLECVGYYPVNESSYDDRILYVIEDVGELPDGNPINYDTISAPLADGRVCTDDPPLTCDCNGTSSDATVKVVYTSMSLGDPGYTVPWAQVDGTPVVFTDRIGSTRSFTSTTRILDGDWDMAQYYLWTDVVYGDDGYVCYDGESAAPCGSMDGFVWETYKANRWDAVDIDADTI